MSELQNQCVVFSAVASNSLGVGLKHTYVLNDAFASNQFK